MMDFKSFARLLLIMAAAVSCSPDGIGAFFGNYTFKAGGYLVLTAERIVDNDDDGEESGWEIPDWPFNPGDDDEDVTPDEEQEGTDEPAEDPDADTEDPVDEPEDPEIKIIRKTVSLVAESGQMDILDNGDGTAVMTLNILGGTALVVNATYEDNRLVIEPYTRIVSISQTESSGQSVPSQVFPSQMTVTVEGTARKYPDMIIFDISYSGEVSFLGDTYKVEESHVEMIAKVNP